MAKEDTIEMEGKVVEALPNAMFRVVSSTTVTNFSVTSRERCGSSTSESFQVIE